MMDGQVTPVAQSNLNVQFLGSANTGTDATSFAETLQALEQSENKKEYRYAPLIVGGLTGVLTTYALVAMWPERKTVGIALAGSGLWSAYNGVKMFR